MVQHRPLALEEVCAIEHELVHSDSELPSFSLFIQVFPRDLIFDYASTPLFTVQPSLTEGVLLASVPLALVALVVKMGILVGILEIRTFNLPV